MVGKKQGEIEELLNPSLFDELVVNNFASASFERDLKVKTIQTVG